MSDKDNEVKEISLTGLNDTVNKLVKIVERLQQDMSNVTENIDISNDSIVEIEQMQDFILDGLIRVRNNEDYVQRYLTKINIWSNEMDEAFSAIEAAVVQIEDDHKPLSLTLTAEEKARYAIRRKSHIIKLRLVPNSEDEFKKQWDKLAINEMENRAKKIKDKHDQDYESKKARDPIRAHLDAVFNNPINREWPEGKEPTGNDDQPKDDNRKLGDMIKDTQDMEKRLKDRESTKFDLDHDKQPEKDPEDGNNGNGDLPKFD